MFRAVLLWRGWWRVLPLVVLGAFTLPHLGDGDWMRGDSGWYAAIAVKSWRTGNWWTLEEGPGRPYFNKPPLVFWIQGLWMWIAGIGAWQARIATVAAAGLCVAAVGGIARAVASRHAALVCGLLLAANIEFFRRTREISLDMWNTAFMLIAAWALVRTAYALGRRPTGRPAGRTLGTRAWRGAACAGGTLGAALMSKPLVGLAVPAILAAWVLVEARCCRGTTRPPGVRRWAWATMAAVIAATVAGVVVAAPWHLSMVRLHGSEFTGAYFGREIAARAAGELVGGQREVQPVWFYLVNAAGAWPMWALVVVLWLLGCSREAQSRRAKPLLRFGVVWSAAWLVILTAFPDRRDRYGLPMHAGLALAAGALVSGRSRPAARAMRMAPPWVAGAAALVAVLPLRFQREAHEQWPALGEWITAQGPVELWDGSVSGAPAARVYLMTGTWPRTTRNVEGRIVSAPPVNSVLLYHRRGGWGPGPGEITEWTVGDLAATRLVEGPWRPVKTEDQGE